MAYAQHVNKSTDCRNQRTINPFMFCKGLRFKHHGSKAKMYQGRTEKGRKDQPDRDRGKSIISSLVPFANQSVMASCLGGFYFIKGGGFLLEESKRMNEKKHTGEPWRLGEYGGIYPENNNDSGNQPKIVGGQTKSGFLPNYKNNETRIVLCVNACAGISNEALESGVIAEMAEALILAITPYVESIICPRFENTELGRKTIPILEKYHGKSWKEIIDKTDES